MGLLKYRFKKFIILLSYDLVAVSFAYYLSFFLRLGTPSLDKYYNLFENSLPWVTLSQIFIFLSFGLYNAVIRNANFSTALNFLKTITFSVLVSNALILLLSYRDIPRSIFIIDWMLLVFLVAGARFSLRFYNELKKKFISSGDRKRVLIYGAGVCGIRLLRELNEEKSHNFKVLGFIDDDRSLVGRKVQEVRVLGTGKEIEAIVKKHHIESIIIAIPDLSGSELKELLNNCRKAEIIPKIVPTLEEILSGKKSIFSLKQIKIEDLLKRSPKSLNFNEIRKFITGKKILISGAGGSIGAELVLQIAKNSPSKLLLLDNNEFNLYRINNCLKEMNLNIAITPLLADVTDKKRINSIFVKHKPEYVFHAAAYKHVPLVEENPCAGIYNNIGGTLNMAEQSIIHHVEKFVLISTDKAVRPTNIMGATKRVCELIVQNISQDNKIWTEFTAVRFGNVLGSSGSVIPKLIDQINNSKTVTITHPEVTRFFMLISEAASLVIQAATLGANGEIFILDMGNPIKIADMAKDLIVLCGKKVDKDVSLTFTGLRQGEKLFEELILKDVESQTIYKDIFIAQKTNVDFSKLKSTLNSLITFAKSGEEKESVSILKSIVPIFNNDEFLANNIFYTQEEKINEAYFT